MFLEINDACLLYRLCLFFNGELKQTYLRYLLYTLGGDTIKKGISRCIFIKFAWLLTHIGFVSVLLIGKGVPRVAKIKQNSHGLTFYYIIHA